MFNCNGKKVLGKALHKIKVDTGFSAVLWIQEPHHQALHNKKNQFS